MLCSATILGWKITGGGLINIQKNTILAILLLGTIPAFADCDSNPGNNSWNVTVDEVAMVVQPKDLEVCSGDVVTWTSTGNSPFHVIFRRGSPPGSPSQQDNWFSIAIDELPGRYEYEVKINGQNLDPSIIINR